MWRLIVQEWKYDSDLILASALIAAMVFAGLYSLEAGNGIVVLPGIPYLILISMQVILLSRRHLERRSRLHHTLPLSVVQIGISRCLFLFGFWGMLLTLYIVQSLFLRDTLKMEIYINRFVFFASLFILSNGAFCISIDIWFDIPRRFRLLRRFMICMLWSVVVGAGLFYSDGTMEVMGNTFPSILAHTQAPFISSTNICLLGVFLHLFSVILYARRRSYLQ